MPNEVTSLQGPTPHPSIPPPSSAHVLPAPQAEHPAHPLHPPAPVPQAVAHPSVISPPPPTITPPPASQPHPPTPTQPPPPPIPAAASVPTPAPVPHVQPQPVVPESVNLPTSAPPALAQVPPVSYSQTAASVQLQAPPHSVTTQQQQLQNLINYSFPPGIAGSPELFKLLAQMHAGRKPPRPIAPAAAVKASVAALGVGATCEDMFSCSPLAFKHPYTN